MAGRAQLRGDDLDGLTDVDPLAVTETHPPNSFVRRPDGSALLVDVKPADLIKT